MFRRRSEVVMVALVVAGCGGGGGQRDPHVLRVPADYATIGAAVDASHPGDTVLVAPGAYHERVVVPDEHPHITIRGADRNRVVLDGRDRLSNGIEVHADGVAVENLTVRRYQVNGVVWSPTVEYGATRRQLRGWRGSYITAYNNGLYGVYAFQSERGRFDHVYASGNPDSGVYVGACSPCHAVVRDNVAEHNQVGYEATNAGGDLRVVRNVWRRNRVGVELNSLRKEPAFPQRGGSVLSGNVVADNDDARAPRGSDGFAAGVVVNGGRGVVVRDNRIEGHAGLGVAVLDSPDDPVRDVTVTANRLADNGTDLVLRTGPRSGGSCFAANRGGVTSAPPRLEALTRDACGRDVRLPPTGAVALPASPPPIDYRRVPAPAAQPSMPVRR